MALTACGEKGPEGKGVSKLEGTSWQLVMDQKDKKAEDCENLTPNMDFLADNKVAGSLGCNLFNTAYKVDGKKFTFELAATTRRMCDPETMKVENRLSKMLGETRYATQDEKSLKFWNEKGELLAEYEPEVPGACE